MEKFLKLLSSLSIILLASCTSPPATQQALPATATPSLTAEVNGDIEVESGPTVSLPEGSDMIGLRSGPGDEYVIVGVLFSGGKLPALGRNQENTWLRVEYTPENNTWVPLDSIELSTPSSELPVSDIVQSPIPDIEGWQGDTVTSVCLSVEQTLVGSEKSLSLLVSDTIERLLTSLGLQVVPSGASCDANLIIHLNLEALGHDYRFGENETEEIRYCYAGAEISGEMVLSAPGINTLTVTIDRKYPLPGEIENCPANPQDAPFSTIWRETILDGLVGIWGHPILLKALEDQEPTLRQSAASVCGKGAQQKEAIPALILALHDPDNLVRVSATEALVSLSTPESSTLLAIPTLIQNLESGDVEVRRSSAKALSQVFVYYSGNTPTVQSVVSALIIALDDSDAEVRGNVAESLGVLRSSAISAVPALIPLLKDQDPIVRANAAEALGKIGPFLEEDVPGLVTGLIQALDDEKIEVRVAAVQALGEIGPRAKDAVPSIISTLEDRECIVNEIMNYGSIVSMSRGPCMLTESIEALGNIGPDSADAVTALLQVFEEMQGLDVPGERAPGETVINTLGKIGPPAKGSVEFLLEKLSGHPESTIRQAAVEALAKIDPQNEVVIYAIINSLVNDEKHNVREAAAHALGEIGPPAAPAIPALIQALGDVVYVKNEASQALAKITGEDFGDDAAAWQQWWDENQSAEGALPSTGETP